METLSESNQGSKTSLSGVGSFTSSQSDRTHLVETTADIGGLRSYERHETQSGHSNSSMSGKVQFAKVTVNSNGTSETFRPTNTLNRTNNSSYHREDHIVGDVRVRIEITDSHLNSDQSRTFLEQVTYMGPGPHTYRKAVEKSEVVADFNGRVVEIMVPGSGAGQWETILREDGSDGDVAASYEYYDGPINGWTYATDTRPPNVHEDYVVPPAFRETGADNGGFTQRDAYDDFIARMPTTAGGGLRDDAGAIGELGSWYGTNNGYTPNRIPFTGNATVWYGGANLGGGRAGDPDDIGQDTIAFQQAGHSGLAELNATFVSGASEMADGGVHRPRWSESFFEPDAYRGHPRSEYRISGPTVLDTAFTWRPWWWRETLNENPVQSAVEENARWLLENGWTNLYAAPPTGEGYGDWRSLTEGQKANLITYRHNHGGLIPGEDPPPPSSPSSGDGTADGATPGGGDGSADAPVPGDPFDVTPSGAPTGNGRGSLGEAASLGHAAHTCPRPTDTSDGGLDDDASYYIDVTTDGEDGTGSQQTEAIVVGEIVQSREGGASTQLFRRPHYRRADISRRC